MLSPANLGGERAALVFNSKATFPLAEQLRSAEGAPLGELFSFVSGLYFRGKMTYGERFGKAPEGLSGALVISAGDGLRFLYERVTLERLQAWAGVSIDASNPRFTEPLVAHAAALEQALGEQARFVLLGSVATDKYVRPLTRVFGERLLFPPEFVGRGDMSRGALLLRSARAGTELAYAPIAGSERHGPRPASLLAPKPRQSAASERELVILVGLPGAGKSTFFRERFFQTHAHVSKDTFRNNARPEERQSELLQQALTGNGLVVVDNTNVGVAERARLIAAARAHGARVSCYFFDCPVRECVARNRERSGKGRIPDVGIFAAAKRLVLPRRSEGFDQLYRVQLLPGRRFEVTPAAEEP